jgi:hypothetical protein
VGREVAGHLVEEHERTQLLGARLRPAPREQAPEQQADEEVPLRLVQVRDVEDAHRRARPGLEQRIHVHRGSLRPGREARGRDDAVQRHRQVHPLVRREEPVEGEHADLGERRVDEPQDDRFQVGILTGGPGLLQHRRQHDVRRVAHRVRAPPDEPEQAPHRVPDQVAQRLGVCQRGRGGPPERAEDVHGDAGLAARREQLHRHAVGEGADPLLADPPAGHPLRPPLRQCRGVLAGGDPGTETRRVQLGEDEAEVGEIALRIDGDDGDPRHHQLLEEDQAHAGLARAGHAQHHAVRPQAGRVEADVVARRGASEEQPVAHL